jgi:hypothetical protein
VKITCDCGKSMMVSDALAGKSVRCPGCGESIFVAPPAQAAPTTGKKTSGGSGFYMSSGMILGISAAVLVLVGGILFYVGPIRVGQQWETKQTDARYTVQNVITYGLKAYLSQLGEFDPGHRPPAVASDDIVFMRPMMTMSLPKKIPFVGNSNNGAILGTYDTETGEVEADVDYGGAAAVGVAVLKKPTGQFHMIGHEENKNPIVTVNGKVITIIYPTIDPYLAHHR